jgi:TonB-linked SusC/RagA family outer membrane protein
MCLTLLSVFIIVNNQVYANKYESSFTLKDQQKEENITGKVLDSKGEAIIGANVIIKGTTKGTVTDGSGKFSISASSEAILRISFIGYAAKEVKVENTKNMTIYLVEDASQLEDVIVVGYNTQKKASIVGSVSSISSENIVTTKNENVQNMLTGKVAGVRNTQLSSEPGMFRNRFDVRGMGSPLIIIDGAPRSNFNRMDPNDIESVSVLKDASAAIYGVQAANGVILITTKSGQKGKVEVNLNSTYGFQVPSNMPNTMDVYQYMDLENENQMRQSKGLGSLIYKEEDYEKYRNGTAKQTDWYDEVIEPWAPQSQHNLSFSGGCDKMKYFINAGYTYQDGIFRKKNDYNKYNLRANISGDLTKRLSFDLKIAGIMDETMQSDEDAWWIIRNMWRVPPMDSVYAKNNIYNYPSVEGHNPVAQSDIDATGYQNTKNRYFQTSVSLNYEIPGIKGLSLNGYYSYDYSQNELKRYSNTFKEGIWNENLQDYSRLEVLNAPRSLRRSIRMMPNNLGNVSLRYKNSFAAGTHKISAFVLYEGSVRSSDNFYAQRELPIAVDQLLVGNVLNQEGWMDSGGLFKYTKKSVVGNLDYDLLSKYLVSFAFRYDGSSRFPEETRWGFFPSFSAGWRISEENFFKGIDALQFMNNFKLRGSYGVLGDDGSSSYQFISGYVFPSDGYVFDSKYMAGVNPKGIPNKNITWYTSKTFDAGFDVSMWEGKVGFTFDVFRRTREGLLTTRLGSLPAEVGATLPQENLNSDQTQGFDMELTHNNRIGKVNYFVRANMSYTRSKNLYVERARDLSSYNNWRSNPNDRYNDIWWGLETLGRFTSYEEIANFTDYRIGNGTVPGDYIYMDWNEDGEITDLDMHPIGYGMGSGGRYEIPRINYGITIGLDYSGFDINMLIQGAALTNVAYIEQLNEAGWGANRANAVEMFVDRWRPENLDDDPYDPSTKWIPGYYLHVGNNVNSNSDIAIQNGSYIRLKSIELGYSLPSKLCSNLYIKDLRFFVNGYNLLTATGVKYLDPEHPGSSGSDGGGYYGYLYPLVKTVNIGFNLKF